MIKRMNSIDDKIPFKNVGIWIVGLLGISSSSFAMFFAFFPQKNYKNPTFFFMFLIIGTVTFFIIPVIINKMKKPHWHIHQKE